MTARSLKRVAGEPKRRAAVGLEVAADECNEVVYFRAIVERIKAAFKTRELPMRKRADPANIMTA